MSMITNDWLEPLSSEFRERILQSVIQFCKR